MGFLILVVTVLIIAGAVIALHSSQPVHPRRRARALNAARPAPAARTWTDTSDTLSALAMVSYDELAVDHAPLDDHTRNTDSSTSWDAGDHCAPADSGSWDSGGDSGGGSDGGGCDSGGSD